MNTFCNSSNIKSNKTINISRHVLYNPRNSACLTKYTKYNVVKIILRLITFCFTSCK